eukprot:6288434-Prymnesium_polylepis.1
MSRVDDATDALAALGLALDGYNHGIAAARKAGDAGGHAIDRNAQECRAVTKTDHREAAASQIAHDGAAVGQRGDRGRLGKLARLSAVPGARRAELSEDATA